MRIWKICKLVGSLCCVWTMSTCCTCVQTLEELPLDTDTSSRPLHSIPDSTGLPSPASKGPPMSPAAYAMANGDFAGLGPQSPSNSAFIGSPRNTKSRRPFHSAEQLQTSNGPVSSNGNGLAAATGSAGYSTIKIDRSWVIGQWSLNYKMLRTRSSKWVQSK